MTAVPGPSEADMRCGAEAVEVGTLVGRGRGRGVALGRGVRVLVGEAVRPGVGLGGVLVTGAVVRMGASVGDGFVLVVAVGVVVAATWLPQPATASMHIPATPARIARDTLPRPLPENQGILAAFGFT